LRDETTERLRWLAPGGSSSAAAHAFFSKKKNSKRRAETNRLPLPTASRKRASFCEDESPQESNTYKLTSEPAFFFFESRHQNFFSTTLPRPLPRPRPRLYFNSSAHETSNLSSPFNANRERNYRTLRDVVDIKKLRRRCVESGRRI